jgi:hypothetical protein
MLGSEKSTTTNRSLHIPMYQLPIENYLIGIKYIVPKVDLQYGLRNEEDKAEVINVMPSAGTIRKSNRINNRPSVKLGDFLWSI